MHEHTRTGAPAVVPFDEQRNALIHNSLIEFVATHAPELNRLYPVLNRILLLLQKPLVVVIFNKPVYGVPAEAEFTHSVIFPDKLKKRIDDQVRAWLIAEQDRFVFPFPGTNGIGLFYIHYRYATDDRQGAVGKRVDPAQTHFSLLCQRDFDMVSHLFQSIEGHAASADYFWQHWRKVEAPLPSITPDRDKRRFDFDVDDFHRRFSPVIDAIDVAYRSLRGGTPGRFSQGIENAGAPMLWARHKWAQEEGGAGHRRPPTIAFFAKLRASEGGYRIVPIVTDAMNRDAASVLHFYATEGAQHSGVCEYLASLDVPDPAASLADIATLTAALNEASDIRHFIGPKRYHSMAYPALQSGLSAFVACEPKSKCDLFVFGPRFLAQTEHGRAETAFIKPTMVAGFPFIGSVSKSSAPIGHKQQATFDEFYYHYVFQMGIVTRRLSRYVRYAAQDAYLEQVGAALGDTLAEFAQPGQTTADGEYELLMRSSWLEAANERMKKSAAVFPYGLTQLFITPPAAEAFHDTGEGRPAFDVRENRFMLGGMKVYFGIGKNPYYTQKLIDFDFVKREKVRAALQRAVARQQEKWEYLLYELSQEEKTAKGI